MKNEVYAASLTALADRRRRISVSRQSPEAMLVGETRDLD